MKVTLETKGPQFRVSWRHQGCNIEACIFFRNDFCQESEVPLSVYLGVSGPIDGFVMQVASTETDQEFIT